MKELADDLKVPIVLLAQINRGVESREDKIPTPSDLKDSGGLEEASDLMILMYLEKEKNEAYFNVVGRDVEGFKVPLTWNSNLAKFEDKV